jgi:hypothetical protein
MRDGDLSQAFKEMLRKEHSVENAYTKYAELVDEKVNRKNTVDPTHVVTWTNKHGFSGRMDKITRLITSLLPRGSTSRSKPFSFKTYHVLTGNGLEEFNASIYRGAAIENVSSFLAGIFSWLFFLSIPLVPVVGTSFLLMTGISFFGFWAAIYSLSSARYRYLPSQLRDISADFWAVHSISGIESDVAPE